MRKERHCKSWDAYGTSGELPALTSELLAYLSRNKTEREIVRDTVAALKAGGAKPVESRESVRPGDVVYMNWKNRAVAAARVGAEPVARGVNAVVSHGDAPRIDVKERPLYDAANLAFFDCHYYGGIKKYHWVNVPLALHGEIHDGKGGASHIAVGEEPDDPVFTIPDLAVHIDSGMTKRTAKEAVEGEKLDAIVGSAFAREDEPELNEHISTNSLKKLIQTRWNFDEKTLSSADLTFVPAGPARELGFDRSLIAAYALDDHICTAASWIAFTRMDRVPGRTAVFMSADKEEIGSDGVSGADGAFFETFLLELLRAQGERTDGLTLRRALAASAAISADVTAGLNPLYESAYVRDQQPRCGNGVVIMKSSGSGGKYDASEARGEMMSAVIELLDAARVPWQVGSFGQIDKAGGGTLAKYIARLGIDIIDIGPVLLSMHSPFEIASKVDFAALKDCFRVFFNEMKSVR